MTELKNSIVGHKPFKIWKGDAEPQSGMASAHYRVEWENKEGVTCFHEINFQNGPIGEVGWNGVIDEALTAILIDRLETWQAGQYANRENALVKTALEESLLWRLKRTLDREARNVEGTHKV